MTGYIYCITNKVNGKKYIGQTTGTVEQRWKQHTKPSTLKKYGHRKLYRAMNLYGVKNFECTTLEAIEISDPNGYVLTQCEQYYIEKFNTIEDGYNSDTPQRWGDHSKCRSQYSIRPDLPDRDKERLDNLCGDICDWAKIPVVLTPEDVAVIFNVDRNTIIQLTKDGTIKGLKIGRFYRYSKENIQKYAGT